ncbi:RNA-directed DNA polymerase [Cronobacter sakazakii]|uniref:reverse transcriptase family protein n=1 Tax=Cronobacter sakazakii TaxID=28141 RepID=UPI000B4B6821|nr:reverse transcriptase family protein [Cronobacter sakazakii]PUW09493.1 RNA-directed DNA polymerase [Cronobacter sakazakii]PUW27037.1 RNA-directed DNA polymerase [Cronobacter sakazakii]PUW27432.1 RNA-directed DNA polymerase [Cronobacter sakazakii]PUW28903.1 RNA-directed DNA polymerase [Cronobacter sakazakii]PUW33770.1 RNA-directed DNA polymerase [Cronobacter sakazakii]
MSSDLPKNTSSKGISSLSLLSKTLGIAVEELREIRAIPLDKRYEKILVPKSDGTSRIVYKPHYKIKKVQRKINSRIFRKLVVWPDFLFGSVPNDNDDEDSIKRDYVTCASLHCGAKSILKIDIRNFFDNIHRELVSDIFSGFFKCKSTALDYLVDFCTKGDFIVQGALTSSYIASLCLYDKETHVVRRARRKGLTYTRLVDDITISSTVFDFDFNQIRKHVEDMLADKDLPLNYEKSGVFHNSTTPLMVHGLRIDHLTPRLPSDEVKRIRASLNNLINLSEKNNSRTSLAFRKEYNRCLGRVNKLGRVGHEKHPIFLKKIKVIYPMPSYKDVVSCKKAIASLETSYVNGFSDKDWYSRKFNLASHKISIINRSLAFQQIAKQLRARLNKVKPDEE